MTNEEIIKYSKRTVIVGIYFGIKNYEDEDVKNKWNLGFLTPEEYEEYRDGDIDYEDILDIYNDRFERPFEYVLVSYSEGYLNSVEAEEWYIDTMTLREAYDRGIISENTYIQELSRGYFIHIKRRRQGIEPVPPEPENKK